MLSYLIRVFQIWKYLYNVLKKEKGKIYEKKKKFTITWIRTQWLRDYTWYSWYTWTLENINNIGRLEVHIIVGSRCQARGNCACNTRVHYARADVRVCQIQCKPDWSWTELENKARFNPRVSIYLTTIHTMLIYYKYNIRRNICIYFFYKIYRLIKWSNNLISRYL